MGWLLGLVGPVNTTGSLQECPHRFGGVPGVCGDAYGDCEDIRANAGGFGVCGRVPTRAVRAPQTRPALGAAPARSRKGRGDRAGWGPRARGWAGGLRGPRGVGGAAPQRPPRRGRPAAMARPRGLGRIPELQLVAFPVAVAAEDEAFLPESLAPRAPRRPRSPPSSPVFFASPSPTFRRRLRLLRSCQDLGRQAWAGAG